FFPFLSFPFLRKIREITGLYLPKLPNWDWKKGDSVICFAELKLGLIAQSCLIPGLTSLLTSLFIREEKWCKYDTLKLEIVKLFSHYTKKRWELCSYLQPLFISKMDNLFIVILILFDNSILINPASSTKIDGNTMGFFVAKSNIVFCGNQLCGNLAQKEKIFLHTKQ
uniref:Calcium-activated potassium channel BK alpha subunit domain-containing protein n=1 Tax=Anolis carolinensis TaxID=28377 RepID=A0A803TG40_ANOCA